MKKEGFILKQTIFIMLLLLGVFSLLNKSLRLRGGREKLAGENRRRDYLLETVQEMGLYELYLLDGYLKKGEIARMEDYFYRDSEGRSILDHYQGFTADREKNSSSMGGYRLASIKPDPEGIYIPGNYLFTIALSKEISLEDEKGVVIEALIGTGYTSVRCYLDPYQEEIECGSPGKIEELSILGEEKDEEGEG